AISSLRISTQVCSSLSASNSSAYFSLSPGKFFCAALTIFSRTARRLCKSSVSSTRIASGQVCATRQPNCSSVKKRSNNTSSGFSSERKSLKLLQLSATTFSSTPKVVKSKRCSDKCAAEAKVTHQFCCKKSFSSCSIRLPAADERGSGQTYPSTNTRVLTVASPE